ncbi:hypothetical protein HN481_03950 [Candidatus Parcubacteria bacterium]|nr:hypothetical protein [Candidatus Parcubacteria bacterium]
MCTHHYEDGCEMVPTILLVEGECPTSFVIKVTLEAARRRRGVGRIPVITADAESPHLFDYRVFREALRETSIESVHWLSGWFLRESERTGAAGQLLHHIMKGLMEVFDPYTQLVVIVGNAPVLAAYMTLGLEVPPPQPFSDGMVVEFNPFSSQFQLHRSEEKH